jgi:hypothetical protein
MSESIKRKIEARKTVNHPANPEVVIGFTGRDVRLGMNVLLLKENAISRGNTLNGESAIIPDKHYANLAENTDYIALLNGDEVLLMDSETAREKSVLHTFDFEDGRNTLNVIYVDDPSFKTEPRDSVELTN